MVDVIASSGAAWESVRVSWRPKVVCYRHGAVMALQQSRAWWRTGAQATAGETAAQQRLGQGLHTLRSEIIGAWCAWCGLHAFHPEQPALGHNKAPAVRMVMV